MTPRDPQSPSFPDDSEFADEFLAVRAAFEEVLVCSLSGADGHTTFATLGVDSLAVAEVCALLEERRGVLVDDLAVSRTQTLGGVAAAIVR